MKEEHNKILENIKNNFGFLWNGILVLIPELKCLFSKKDVFKLGQKYYAKCEALFSTNQKIITSCCLLDDYISSLSDNEKVTDFKILAKAVASTISLALDNARLRSDKSILQNVQQLIKEMIITIDVNPGSNNSDYRNRLHELLVFNWLCECENIEVVNIAYPLGNNKDCDFKCVHKNGDVQLIEVMSIHNIDLSMQDNAETFSDFIKSKVKLKYETKTKGLKSKPKITILPILDYVEGLCKFGFSMSSEISMPAFTVVRNTICGKSEILLIPIEQLKSKDI